jgi:hypothetical protein
MNRRAMMGALGAGAAGLAAVGTAAGQERQQHEGHHGHYDLMTNCARRCAEAARHCLDQLREGSGNREQHAQVLSLASGCEKFCMLTAGLMACQSPLSPLAHEANAEACRMCAEACEKHSDAGEVIKACGEACRACEKACAEAASAGGHDHHRHQGARR